MNVKKLTVLAMLSALAYIIVAVVRIPVVQFLKYEPKDVIIVIGGFLFGPVAAFAMSLVVSLVEMVTISDTWIIGAAMNVISSSAFACTAAFIYMKRRTIGGAALGLAAGVLLMAAMMMLWNYLITPIYMGLPRAAVAEMLLPVFLPFNLLKGGLNAALTMLLYKPSRKALSMAGLTPQTQNPSAAVRFNVGVALVSAFVIVSCVIIILVFQKIL